MDPKLLTLLGLAVDSKIETVIDAIAKMQGDAAKMKEEIEKASSEVKVKTEELATARSTSPSLDKFVPRADYELAVTRANSAEKQIEDTKKETLAKEVASEIEMAVKSGKIAPASKDFYVSTCSTREGFENFKKFAQSAPNIVPDSGLDGKKPPVATPTLSEMELSIARSCGLTAEKFIAARDAK